MSLRLIQYSFLMLFVELALIRITGANFIFLAFFTNFILMASFLGIAIGFLYQNKNRHLFNGAIILLATIFLLCHVLRYEYQINLQSNIDDISLYINYFSSNAIPTVVTLPFVFLATTAVMAALANGTAQAFRALPPIKAYQLEITGSLLGVAAFTVLSFLQTKPLIWGLVITFIFISLLQSSWRRRPLLGLIHVTGLMLMLTVLQYESNAIWSPYYKIAVKPYSQHRYVIDVNGIPQQFIESVAQKQSNKPFYFYPYQHLPAQHALNHVLVIGAGTGGDVAVALAQGAKQVDAVEIDPALQQIGATLHTNHPYQDKRVTTYINDGRAFLQQSHQQYDLIILALTDSLTLVTHQSSLRLENYLLTVEGLQAARQHLTKDGVFAMYNYYRNNWVVDKVGNSLTTVFATLPCVDTEGENNHWLSVFTVSNLANLRCQQYWSQTNARATPTPATDNRPFFYMQSNEITTLYLYCLSFILLISLLAVKVTGTSYRRVMHYSDLLLMGTAFLLLETKNITQFALLFGTTWLVNALVFTGILFTVLCSIVTTQRIKSISLPWLASALFCSLCASWLVPNQALLTLPVVLRLFAAIALAFSPVYFANIIFAARFRATAHATDAFAANILGAMLGGLLEYSSLLIGYQNLLLIAAGLYLLALYLMPQPKMIPTTKNSGAATYS